MNEEKYRKLYDLLNEIASMGFAVEDDRDKIIILKE